MEYILGLIVAGLIGYIVWKDKQVAKERRELLSAVISKNAVEFATANVISEQPEERKEEQPEFIPQESQSDEDFTDSIHKSIDDSEDES